MIERIAILDRGVAAVRLIQAVRDLELPGGGRITTIAVHAAEDRTARFVREADEALEMNDDASSVHERVLREARADAIWCGGRLGGGRRFTPEDEADARRLEVQVVADGKGAVWVVGVRDCSVRRGGQVVVAESAPGSRELRLAAERHVRDAGLAGVATAVFHSWPQTSSFEFAGLVDGLQDEHVVTEMTAQLDLVKLQLVDLAAAGRPRGHGHAIGVRLLAVDPDRGFAAAGGRVVLLRLPTGAGIRVDTGLAEGDVIPGSDPLVATVAAHGANRDEALARLRRALGETMVLIEGGCTDKSFLAELLDAEELISGSAVQGWVDRALAGGRLRCGRHGDVALIAAAVECHRADEELEIARFMDSARAGRAKARAVGNHLIELELRGKNYWVHVRRSGPTDYLVAVDGGPAARVAIDRLGEVDRRITVDGMPYRLVTAAADAVRLVEVEGTTHRVMLREGFSLTSPSPALVVAAPAVVGCELAAGAPVMVLESMKLETVVRAPFACRVGKVLVAPGNQVDAGVVLARVERLGEPSTLRSGGKAPVVSVRNEQPQVSELERFVEAVELDLDSCLRAAESAAGPASTIEEGLYRSFVARQSGSDEAKAAAALLASWLKSCPRDLAAEDLVARMLRWAPGLFPEVVAIAWSVYARWFGRLTRVRGLDLWRLSAFETAELETPADVVLLDCRVKVNPADRRVVAIAESGGSIAEVERAVAVSAAAIRATGRPMGSDEIWICVPSIEGCADRVDELWDRIAPVCASAGIDEVLIQPLAAFHGQPDLKVIRSSPRTGTTPTLAVVPAPSGPVTPLDRYTTKVRRSRRRGLTYPYELLDLLCGHDGVAVELDLDDTGLLVPVSRPRGSNRAGLVVARVTTPTPVYPEGISRIVVCGDPTMALGAVAEPECQRIVAAINLAEKSALPVEWFALSAGARISMDSGTENMDWVASALRRIIEFTQAGGEINIVVAGINVGAQPYWNAEATMLMHTRGILVMTPDSAMVLTGKQSLDFSGGVSAADNFGIGGYEQVMGPNGQAQYWAPDLVAAYGILLRHYEFTTVVSGEGGPRRAVTNDPADRDITQYPHAGPGSDFTSVGQIFSSITNPGRKKAFDIRTVLRAVADQDCLPLERWADMWDAETTVVFDARIGGYPVCMIGIESRPLERRGGAPIDGPGIYTAGTLFPQSAKKAARAINAASGNRPLVILANLSGFDGSPDSLRSLQLEYGAEIGRATVNFRGPIVFCVISRYHGGAFVVFSKRLNPAITVLAVEGSYASVIGGAPAAAVVFAGEVSKRVASDPRVVDLRARATTGELAQALAHLEDAVRAEKLGEVAGEFDGVHDIHRAVAVGSVDEIVSAQQLRPRIVATLSRGLRSVCPKDGVS